jgi:hypothetical protein
MEGNKRNSGKEYFHLINDYLGFNTEILQLASEGRPTISGEELQRMLYALHPFERPDMYAIVDDKVYILEHFAFDASEEDRNGMRGIKEENKLIQRANSITPDGEIHFDRGDYSNSLTAFQQNFEKHFTAHYKKIDEYRENLMSHNLLSDKNELVVGFWAENQYPPLYQIDGRFRGELYYFYTKQFSKLLLKSRNIDYMLFGCNYDGPKLFYVDRSTLLPDSDQIDLSSHEVSLSPLEKNEVTMYSSFVV